MNLDELKEEISIEFEHFLPIILLSNRQTINLTSPLCASLRLCVNQYNYRALKKPTRISLSQTYFALAFRLAKNISSN